jgi:hypothetical protein
LTDFGDDEMATVVSEFGESEALEWRRSERHAGIILFFGNNISFTGDVI